MCAAHDVKLCLDAISSVGTLPVDLRGVYFASASSGKGLRAYPGLAIAFYHHEVPPSPRLPRYLDLGHYARNQGVAFTHSSNLVHALHASLKRTPWPTHFAEVAGHTDWLRGRLRELGFDLIEVPGQMSPAVTTLRLPAALDSLKVGAQLQESGYLVSCNSDYLRARNWIQVCFMGECSREKIVSLANALNRICFKRKPAATAVAG
jgi:aspartate aminotransferase-like enzyme